jgi:FAD/FMN-containing dehydrogenase
VQSKTQIKQTATVMSNPEFLASCVNIVGAAYLLSGEADMAPFLTDWRGRFTGAACAVARPGSTAEVAALVRLCQQYQVPMVPQGGNTGLVLGSVPDQRGNALLISLLRLNRIRHIDPVNQTITVEAGCLLAQVQQVADEAQRLFPLSLGSEGSCSIGGNLSTNAGGTAVLRYGNMRELCLGLEVVTAEGEVWDGLRALRKDNTGYDLRDLFIGAEGTLGIISAAVLKLYPQPQYQLTALVALPTVNDALSLFNLAQDNCGATLTGFELMSGLCLRLVQQQFAHLASPFEQAYAQYVLLELSDHEDQAHTQGLLERLMELALERGLISDAVVATSLAQSQRLWQIREHIPLAQAADGKNIKHDIALPLSHIAAFIEETEAALRLAFEGCRLVCFGHIGDGNLHFNVAAPEGGDADAFLQHQSAINRLVYDRVQHYRGSISAEHGIGALKPDELRHYKTALEIELMRKLKRAFDPNGLMNPGKILGLSARD